MIEDDGMAAGNYGRNVRYMVLGPLRVTRDGEELPLGGPQQRLVLALLIQANGRAVSTANLIDGVWGEDEPATAKKTLQGYIHHLRSQVGDVLKTEGAGYSLDTKGAVDVVEFEKLRETGMEAMAADPSNAANLFRNALALWSGPPYADLDGHHAVAPEAARLTDLRIAVLGDRIDADLACGGHNGLIGELEGLTQEYPLQDRFRAQHMLALFRAGRQVEALRSFERTRRFLGEEMGLEPSADLQRLEQQILAGDEELLLGDAGDPSGRSAVRGYELREVVKTGPSRETYRAYQRSVGREVTVEVLGAEIADDPVFIANYLADTQRVAALEHPNIGFVHDTWREPGRAYLVSRWFGGGSLAHNLEDGPMRMAEAMGVIDQIGAAVSYAHRHGVAHGALNAGNVMLDDEGNAHLTGFVVGSGLEPDLAGDRRAFAALAYLLLVGRPPRQVADGLEADLLGVDLPSGVGSVFEVAFESSAGYGRVEDFLRGLRQVLGADSVVPTTTAAAVDLNIRNPYKGLRAFQESDADDFYGRAELIDRLVDRLDHNRLVAVVGPSGSGKSSVVKAGLAARVRAREDGVLHLQTEMFPGAFPFEELEGALLRVGVNRDSVIGDLLADERGLLRVLKQILPSDDSELLLVIDQFEELFSMVSERKVAQLFLSSLATAAADPRSRLRVVMTMRADFFDRPLESPEFASLMEAGLVPVSLPDREGLAAAVSQPALSVGLDFEDGLIDRIVRDLDDQPGGLPLLQYAMTELVEQRTGSLLTFAAYEGIGGVYGALGQRAEDLYQSLKPRAQEALRQAFLRMVSVDESAKDLRRRVTQAELLATEVDDQSLNEALQLFGGHRLLTFDLDPVTRARTVEVAHEALTREWDRLSEWIEDQRDDIVIRKRLDAARLEWQQAAEDASYLPSGSRLAQFEEWSRFTTLSLSTDERSFLEAASEREDEESERSTRRRRGVLVGLATAIVLLAFLAGVALLQKGNADDAAAEADANAELATANAAAAETNAAEAKANAEQADANALEASESEAAARASAASAETGRIASEAAARADTDPQLALLLASEAYARDPSITSLTALQRVMVGADPIVGYLGSADRQYLDVEWDESGKSLVAAHLGGVEVYDGETRLLLHDLEVNVSSNQFFREPAAAPLVAFDVSPNGRFAIVGTAPPSFALVDLQSGMLEPFEQTSFVASVAFSNDSSRFAVGSADGNVAIWDTATRERLIDFSAHPEEIRDYDDELQDLGIPLADIELYADPALTRPVSGLVFTSDDALLISTESPLVRTWDPSTGLLVNEFVAVHPGYGPYPWPIAVDQIEVMPDDPSVVRLAHRDRLVDFDLTTGERLSTIEVPTDRQDSNTGIAGVDVRPNGDWIVALSDGRIRVLDEFGAPTLTVRSVLASPGETDLSPDGSLLAAGGEGGIVLLAVGGGSPITSVAALDAITYGLGVDSSGEVVVASTESGLKYFRGEGSALRSDPSFDGSDLGSGLFVDFGTSSTGTDFGVVSDFTDDPAAAPFGFTGSVFDLETREQLGSTVFADSLAFAFSPDDRYFVSSSVAVAVVMDMTSGAEVAQLDDLGTKTDFGLHLRSLSFSADGARLIGANRSGAWQMWDTSTWEPMPAPLELGNTQIASFSPDGLHLATVDDQGTINLRDQSTFASIRVLTGAAPAEAIGPTVYWSTNGEYLLTLFEQVGRLWDVSAGQQIGDTFPNDVGVFPAGASGDTLQLATALGGSLRLWNLDVDSWPEIACNAAGRNMTEAEWEQFGPKDTEYRATCPQYPIEE